VNYSLSSFFSLLSFNFELALFVFLRLPEWISFIHSPVSAGQVMYWIVGAFFIISGIVIFFGLSPLINDDNKV
jgi:hypothetical protein